MALLHCGRLSFAQNQSPLTEYTTENGLSLNSVNDLLFDKQGFLWVLEFHSELSISIIHSNLKLLQMATSF